MLETIPVADIDPHELNPRRELGDVTELAQSIEVQGLVQPIILAPAKEPGRWVIIAGHRRFAAIQQLGWETVDAVVRKDLTDPAAVISAMLVENNQRSNLKISEEGDALLALSELGLSKKDIAARAGRSQTWVKPRMMVAGLSERMRNAVDDGQLSLVEAQAFTELDAEAQSLVENAPGGSISGMVVYQVRLKERRDLVEKAKVSLALSGHLEVDEDAGSWTEVRVPPGQEPPEGARFKVIDFGVGQPDTRWFIEPEKAAAFEEKTVAERLQEWKEQDAELDDLVQRREQLMQQLCATEIDEHSAREMLREMVNDRGWVDPFAVLGSRDASKEEVAAAVDSAAIPQLVAMLWRMRNIWEIQHVYPIEDADDVKIADALIDLHGWQPAGDDLKAYRQAGGTWDADA